MERKNQIEGLDLPLKKQTSSDERQMSISQSVRDNNCKIIKLIREKIYPLHASEKSTLIFPKLKEKYSRKNNNMEMMSKKYVQIDLNEEQMEPQSKGQTDIEDQLVNKQKIKDLKKTNEVETSEFTFYSKIGKPKKKLYKKVETEDSQETNKQNLNNRYSSLHEQVSTRNLPVLPSSQNQTTMMNHQAKFHSQYLIKIKKELEKQKQSYKQKINFTDLEGSKDKQDYSIEYIVNLLEKKREKEKCGVSSYSQQDYSPNNLPEFMKLLKKKKERPLKLWEQFEQSQSLKDKITEQDLRSRHLIEYSIQKNIAVVEEQNEIQLENILSAKYRLKVNHKKMVEIAKNKSKS